MRIGIIGGGLLGISLAYFLSEQGEQVEVFEASPNIGGLAGPSLLPDGTKVDRFYHAILSSDQHLIGLIRELGIYDQLRFAETRMGFYYRDQIFSMNNIVEFLRFPPLGWIDRFRLGLTVLYAPFVRDWHQLEGISVKQWLIRLSGRRTYENIWRPLLRAKFDGSFENTPATYIWSRLVRMKSTRGGASQKEMAGYLTGGYSSLIEAMAERIKSQGGRIRLNTPVQEIMIANGVAWGLYNESRAYTCDRIISTLQVPIFIRLISDAPKSYHEYLERTDYLGIVAPLLVMDRPLSGYWTINITEDRIPFTGVIETTTYIDSKYVGGHHLIYLPKYTSDGSDWQNKSDDEIREIWLQNLETMFPEFDRSSVRYFMVHSERYVEPIHRMNETENIPSIETPVKNLYLATTAQIYPQLTNGESIVRFAKNITAQHFSRNI
jgi:protoporphyrinogen oxidase